MSRENSDIRFEETDVNTKGIAFSVFWLFVFICSVSAAMIPLCFYFWNHSYAAKNAPAEGAPSRQPQIPQVMLETTPNYSLSRMHAQVKEMSTDEKIAQAMKESLKEGFPARKQ